MSLERRHILIMSSWYPTRMDPFSGNFVERFAKLLSKDYQVSVIHTRGDKSVKTIETVIEEEDSLRTIRIYHPVHKNRFWHWLTQRKAFNKALSLVEEVDLVFAHVILPRGWQFTKAKSYYHCGLVVMEHASYYRKEAMQSMSRLHHSILKSTSRHINELLACSEFLQEDMKRIFPTTKTTVLPNFVDTTMFYPDENKTKTGNRFLHVSTLDERVKNPKLLIEAVNSCVKAGFLQTHMTIVSDQPMDKWIKLAESLSISKHFTFKGPASWEEIANEMRDHDAFVLSSSYETFSIVLVESWLSGIPTITTPVGIGKDLDPALGIQVPVNDAEAIAQAMQAFMSGGNKYNADSLRNAGMQFSEENVIAKAREVFERNFDIHG